MPKNKKQRVPSSPKPGQDAAAASTATLFPWLLPISVVALTMFFFLPVLRNGFVDWDDQNIILGNPNYRGLDWVQLRWMFTTFYMGHYQPLSWMSLGLDYLLWGINPFGYHLTNLLLHSFNALVFYFLTMRMLSLALPGAASNRGLEIRGAAWFAALIFAIHPLRVESVAWVTERRDVLSGLFFLLSVACYLRGATEAKGEAARWRWMASALIVYCLSLLSKAAGMTLPVVLLVLDVYPLRRLGSGANGWFGAEARKVWWEKAPFFLLAVVFAVVALNAQRAAGAMLSLESYGVSMRLAQALFGIAFYLWKTVVPLNLSPVYALSLHLQPSDWLPFILSGAVDLAIIIGLVIGRNRWPAALASWIYYLVLLAPVLGFAQSGPQIAADRYTYLSCLGWAMLFSAVLFRLGQNWSGRRRIIHFLTGFVAVIVVTLGGLTWRQAGVWHDSETLWRHAIGAFPRAARAHNNLGNALVHRGEIQEAIEQYRQALQVDPLFKEAHENLGLTLAGRGEFPEAIEHYRAALRIDPGYKQGHNNLGIALFYADHIPEAIEEYRAALRVDPDYKETHNNLGISLIRQGDLAAAIEHFRTALRIDPGYKEAHYNLGNALADQGELTEAIEQYREALRIDPGYQEARYNLSVLLQEQTKK